MVRCRPPCPAAHEAHGSGQWTIGGVAGLFLGRPVRHGAGRGGKRGQSGNVRWRNGRFCSSAVHCPRHSVRAHVSDARCSFVGKYAPRPVRFPFAQAGPAACRGARVGRSSCTCRGGWRRRDRAREAGRQTRYPVRDAARAGRSAGGGRRRRAPKRRRMGCVLAAIPSSSAPGRRRPASRPCWRSGGSGARRPGSSRTMR